MAGEYITADRDEAVTNALDVRLADAEAALAPLPGRVTFLDTTVGNILGNTIVSSAVGTTDGGGVLSIDFPGTTTFDAVPTVVAGMGDFTGTSFACQVIHSSVTTDGFDVLITKFPDTGGEGAAGETVRVNYFAAGPWA